MFHGLGRFVSQTWVFLLIGWVALLGVTWAVAPPWNQVAEDGEFGFLPKNSPSRLGERLLKEAFPGDSPASSVVIVLRRKHGDRGLLDEDRGLIKKELEPALESLAKKVVRLAPKTARTTSENPGQPADSRAKSGASSSRPVIERIRTLDDPVTGPLLVSEDGRATLVVVNLATEFRDAESRGVVNEVEALLGRLKREGKVPSGLDVGLTGSAAVGRDLSAAKKQSAREIESWTIWLIVGLLLAIYRAPLVALLPLLTIVVAMQVATQILAILAGAGYVGVFLGLEVYSRVVVYGAGVDYSLFLIARYREELEQGAAPREAVAQAVGRVGAALAASAGTVMLGIGMLRFAEFRKFQEAGIAIAFGLFVMLMANLTLTPALLRISGRFAFWPSKALTIRRETGRSLEPTSAKHRAGWLEQLWTFVGHVIEHRPATVWIAAVLLMAPFAVVAVRDYNRLSFGLLQELPSRAPSVAGTQLLQDHFPAGITGGLVLLVENPKIDFSSKEGIELITTLVRRLEARRRELRLADLRSVPVPLGITQRGKQALAQKAGGFAAFASTIVQKRAIEHYVTNVKGLGHHVTRIDLILDHDPFSRQAMDELRTLDHAVRSELPGRIREGTRVYFSGVTSSLRDLRDVARVDRVRISVFVTLGVLAVLVVLLRRIALPLYLIVTVLFSYLVTIGVSNIVFGLADPHGFVGLDWTVPIFLFALLVAVGEDYNIFLVARIDEERASHGPIQGIIQALQRTGGIISSCGVIMAGTFFSLLVGGSISSMRQLGFALSFGVLLDTFVIRPILVPSFLVLANNGTFRALGEIVGLRHATMERQATRK